MTVPVQDPIVSYVGNGIATQFTVPFRILAAEDLFGLLSGALTTSYTLTGLGADECTATFATPPVVGASVIFYRQVALDRLTDYQNNGDLLAVTVNADFDRIWMALQDVGGEYSRAVRFPITEYNVDGTLPIASVRANNLYGFDSNGAPVVVPIPASVGAGDLKVEEWLDGIGYTSGTSSTVTLSRPYGTKANLGTVVMDGIAQDPATYKLSSDGLTLTFTDTSGNPVPIPALVQRVWCIGGTTISLAIGTLFTAAYAGSITRTIVDKLRDTVSVMDFGADSTGINESTAAFQNAVNSARKVIIPAGTFTIGPVTVPSNTVVVGEGYASLVKAKAGVSGQGLFQTANAAQFVSIGNMRIDISPADAPYPMGVYLHASAGATVHDIVMVNSGNHGVGSDGDSDTTLERLTLSNSFGGAIYLNNSARPRIRGCKVDDSGGLNSGITISIGSDVTVEDNYVASMIAGFGIHLARVTRGKILHNTTLNTKIEGINVEGCTDIDIFDNICTWTGSVSNDFGISVFGSTAQGDCIYIKVRGNKVYNCASSGIALAAQANTQFCDVSDNTIVNCNAKNLSIPAGGGAGVMLYGAGCQQNTIQNNKIVDTGVAHLLNGIQEVDAQGYGQAATNRFINNHIYNAASAAVSKQTSSVEALSRDPSGTTLPGEVWTSVVTPTGGAFGGVSVNTARYYETERCVHYYINFTISTNGTGTGAIHFTLPYPALQIGGSGRENAVTGKGLTVVAGSGNTGEVRFYDGSYPGANGAIIEVSGTFFRQ